MSIFRKKFKTEVTTRRSTEVYADMISESENLIDYAFEASGASITDLISDMDEDTGRVVKKCMDSYKRIMDLAMEQAEIIDRMEIKLDALTETNEKLMTSVNYLVSLTK